MNEMLKTLPILEELKEDSSSAKSKLDGKKAMAFIATAIHLKIMPNQLSQKLGEFYEIVNARSVNVRAKKHEALRELMNSWEMSGESNKLENEIRAPVINVTNDQEGKEKNDQK
eukprot:Trichotokara_eunicae@DN7153_c0_g1_i1.p1